MSFYNWATMDKKGIKRGLKNEQNVFAVTIFCCCKTHCWNWNELSEKKTETTDSDFAICVKHGSEFWWCDKSRQMILDIDNAHCCTLFQSIQSGSKDLKKV